MQSKQGESNLSTSPVNQPGIPSVPSSSNLAAKSVAPEIMDAYIKSCGNVILIRLLSILA